MIVILRFTDPASGSCNIGWKAGNLYSSPQLHPEADLPHSS